MARIEILKTYKIYIGGQFPRTESGRAYSLQDKKGKLLANICLSSRKDLRNAVVAARSALATWSSKSAFNRSQILYRIAEMLEARKMQFIAEMLLQGSTKGQAEKEVAWAVDRLVYYAGWCDKFQQIISSVNPVASSHFNFSVPEPMGVIGIIAPEENSLIGLVSTIASVIAGGNTCVLLASESKPLCSISFAEVLNSSDVPGGTVNILTGTGKELTNQFASHLDINAILYCRKNSEEQKSLVELGAQNLKRVFWKGDVNWLDASAENLEEIVSFQEIKTTWHPIENIGSAKAAY